MVNILTIITQPFHDQHTHNYHQTSPWPTYSQWSHNLSMANILTIIPQPFYGQHTHSYHPTSPCPKYSQLSPNLNNRAIAFGQTFLDYQWWEIPRYQQMGGGPSVHWESLARLGTAKVPIDIGNFFWPDIIRQWSGGDRDLVWKLGPGQGQEVRNRRSLLEGSPEWG